MLEKLKKAKKQLPDNRETKVKWLNEGEAEKLWYMDAKGDKDNLLFGELYRLDIPIYHRRRICLGMSHEWIVNFDKRGNYFFYLRDGQSTKHLVRYTKKKFRNLKPSSKNLSNQKYQNLPKEKNSKVDDFIPLETFDVDIPSDEEEREREERQRRISEYNRRTREEPTNVNLWLEYLNFFQDLFRKNLLPKMEGTGSFWETQASICEAALNRNPRTLR
eukprot:TRINITY_DN5086_c0_g1_i2.p1 TRINITY_DN5086_c0_g1~~TRINITY_DN5086_c0_g1_i2.p1  ORF type:complete len:218 (-),score=44.38 TRINITY_DN5086_c0_g1_i2:5-658(-)